MAYSTGGSGGAMVDLMDAIRAFALGLGWTIDKWDSTDRLLFMTKGLCTVTMWGDTTRTARIYYGANGSGTYTSPADHRIYFAMGTSNNGALTTYYNHPGSPVTSDYDNDAPYVMGMNGPFIAWHLFADPTVSDHIHVVVQISAEVYMHFSFGHVDKKGLTHSGVAYVTATPAYYYRNVSNYTNGTSGSFNAPDTHHVPFAYGSGQTFLPASYNNSPPIILKHSDAWPATWMGPVASAAGVGNNYGLTLPTIDTGEVYRPEQWPRAVSGQGHLLNCVVAAEPAPYSNVLPLFPIPVLRNHYDSSVGNNSRRICYVGDFPNVRLCNMTNLIPGQEITVGSDTFKVFPTLRQGPWTDRLAVNAPLSGQFAIAYKKVP